MLRKTVGSAALIVFICSAEVSGRDPLDYFGTYDKGTAFYMFQVEHHHLDKNNAGKSVLDNIRTGFFHGAVEDLKYVLDRIPNHPRGLQLLGTVSQMTKKPALAVEYFERAIKLYPQHALTRAQYGLFLTSIGSVSEGIETLKLSIEMDPKLAAGYAGLAHAYAKKGDTNKAREAAEKARELGYKGQLPAGLM
jgi:predicted Zn-dependent protease